MDGIREIINGLVLYKVKDNDELLKNINSDFRSFADNPDRLLKNKIILSDFITLGKFIKKGNSNSVFSITMNDNTKLILRLTTNPKSGIPNKLIGPVREPSQKVVEFLKEMKLAYEMGSKCIGPKVLAYGFFKNSTLR